MKNKQKIVMFDFDGVLVNTTEFIFELHKNDNNELTWEMFQDLSNGNFFSEIEKATNSGIYHKPNNWDNIYSEKIKNLTIQDIFRYTIKQLSNNCVLSIVSSSSSDVIKRFLEKENVDKYFEDIYGADVNKIKSVKIKMLLDKYKIDKNNAVFITDSLGDIYEAHECGVKCIGVTWGIHQRETLIKGIPESMVEDPRFLLDVIKNMLKLV